MKANPMNPKNPPSAAKAIKIPKSSGNRADLQKVNRPKTNQGSAELFKKGGDTMATKMNPGMMAMMAKKKEGMHKMPDGKMMKNSAMKMAGGGMPMVMKDGKKVPAFAADGEGKMKHGGMTKMGSVKTSSKPDGVAKRGLTKGTQVTMKKGGKC